MTHAQTGTRPDILFERDIQVQARDNGTGLTVEGWLRDSFHEMTLEADFSYPDLVITRIAGTITRYPHQECLPGMGNLQRCVGVKAGRNFFHKIEEAYGGGIGCTHLLNLLYEVGLASVQARFEKTGRTTPEEVKALPQDLKTKMYLRFQPGMRNSCVAWANESPLVRRADALPDRE